MKTFGLVLVLAVAPVAAQDPPLRESDRIRLAEVFRISEQIGDSIWTGWNEPPFPVLLVTPDREILLRHPRPSADFERVGFDPLLQSDVLVRPRVFDPSLLATFPAVGGIPTIVIGLPENTTAATSTRWVLTVMHERFHQLQNHQPDYYANVNRLDLSGGDQTGMWMLNYPFPYDTLAVYRDFNHLARNLRETLITERPLFTVAFNRYRELRKEFRELLSDRDYRYWSFQLWQEGVSRYVEIRTAELAARWYEPTPEFRGLADYTPFSREADASRRSLYRQLRTMAFRKSRRESFYPFGAAEAMLLDRVRPEWKKEYFADPFFLERYYEGRE